MGHETHDIPRGITHACNAAHGTVRVVDVLQYDLTVRKQLSEGLLITGVIAFVVIYRKRQTVPAHRGPREHRVRGDDLAGNGFAEKSKTVISHQCTRQQTDLH